MKTCLKYFVLIFCLKFIGAVLASPTTLEIKSDMVHIIKGSSSKLEIFTGIPPTLSQGDYHTVDEGSQSFRCDYEYSSEAKGWFKHFVVPATWYDARLRCALEGAVLASPATPEIKHEMIYRINSSESEQPYEVFTGLHATFAKGAYHTVEGTPLSKIPQTWAPNEPDNKDNKENCLSMNSYGDLADLSCEATRPFFCYRSKSSKLKVNECGTVDPEYRLNNKINKCYKFHTVSRNFSRAFLTCAAEGGHLAIINSDTEAGVLSDLFNKYPVSSLPENDTWRKNFTFIGFHDWNERGDWRTIHGQTLVEAGYSKFSKAEPNNLPPGEYCGAMFRSGELDDMFCFEKTPFICEKSPDYNAACLL